MDLTAAIIIVIAVILVGLAVVTAVRRRDRSVQAAVEAAVAQVAEDARSAFDTRLATGTVELEQRHQAIDKQLETMRSGFSEQMTTMSQALSELRTDAASQHSSIKERLKDAVDRTAELNKTTRKLSDVLSNPTSRGKWGELMAEDILRVVGMKEGINYVKQTRIASGKIPDYTFLLPKGEKLHMDVKFPLEAHCEHLEASSEVQRKEATKKFKLAVRNHVSSLVGREGYLDSQETIDCVLMFIPNDGVYAAVQEQCQDEAEKALEKGVLICSPSTLLAVLVIVRKAMDTFALERSAQEVLDVLGTFQTQWDKFTDAIATVSSRADSLRRGVDELMPGGTRRNVLERELNKIDHLRSQSGSLQLEIGSRRELETDHVDREGHLREAS